jgi:flagellar biosynthesis/type III secretory pathway protein FliH
MLTNAYNEYSEMAQKALKKAAAIDNAFAELLEVIHALGVAEGIEEKEDAVEDAHTLGFDEGYEEAKREFHAPDL